MIYDCRTVQKWALRRMWFRGEDKEIDGEAGRNPCKISMEQGGLARISKLRGCCRGSNVKVERVGWAEIWMRKKVGAARKKQMVCAWMLIICRYAEAIATPSQ